MSDKAFDFSAFIAERLPPPGTTPWRYANGRPKFDFGTGFPDPDSFPADGLHEALGRALKDHGRDMVLYPDPQGFLGFREFISEKLQRERGIIVSPERILVIGGSGVALSIVTQLFTNPGDTLITEEFTYGGTLNVMKTMNANVIGIPTDYEGMRPDILDNTISDLKRKGVLPKFIYTIPSFQNPLGTDMSITRRREILKIAQENNVPVFEDDAYEDLRFSGDRSPAIFSYDDREMMMYCGTFSKIVAPSMRLGYLVAPQSLMPHITALHQGRPTSQFAELATYYYLRDNLDDHVAEISEILRAKRDTMLGALGEFMGPNAVVNKPSGGMYLWVRMPDGSNLTSIAVKALEKGVSYLPGTSFSPTEEGENFLRLCFGYESHQAIRDGIALLAEVFGEEGLL